MEGREVEGRKMERKTVSLSSGFVLPSLESTAIGGMWVEVTAGTEVSTSNKTTPPQPRDLNWERQ
jgi:hypothetical protein